MTLSSARSSDAAADFALVGYDDGGTFPVAQGTGRGGRGPMSAHFEGGRVNLMAVEFDGEHVIAGLFGRVFQFVRVCLRLFYFALLNDARGSWEEIWGGRAHYGCIWQRNDIPTLTNSKVCNLAHLNNII